MKEELDPFAPTANVAMYIERPAIERALGELLALVRGGEPCIRLAGPAGIGKTLLLRKVAKELGPPWRCVYLPYPKLGPDELWYWTAQELRARGTPETAVARVAAKAHDQGGAVLLMVDDAHLQPATTRRSLAKACAHHVGLRLLLCETADLSAEVGSGAPGEVWLTEPGSPVETREYVRERLIRAGASNEAYALFDDATIDDLHRQAAGSVASLHTLATAVLRRRESKTRDRPALAGVPPVKKVNQPAPEPASLGESGIAPGPESLAASPRRPLTDREAIAEIAANLSTSYKRPAPAPAYAGPPAGPEAPRKTELVESTERGARPVLVPGVPDRRASLTERIPKALAQSGVLLREAWPEALSGDRARWIAAGLVGGLLLGVGGSVVATSWLSSGTSPSEVEDSLASNALGAPDVAAPPPRPSHPEVATERPREIPEERVPVSEVPAIGPESPDVDSVASRSEVEAAPAEPFVAEVPVLGRLNVNAIPWASIEIDGEAVGETPLGELAIPQGSRRLVARFPDGQVVERTVELEADEIFLVLRPDEG